LLTIRGLFSLRRSADSSRRVGGRSTGTTLVAAEKENNHTHPCSEGRAPRQG
jgi:hypothetical protein